MSDKSRREVAGEVLGGLLVLMILAAMVLVNIIEAELGGLAGAWQLGQRPLTWVFTLVLLSLALLLGGWFVTGRLDGIFIDKDNRISLPRFQLVVWTAVLVSALVSAGLSNAELGYPEPLKIDVPPSIWALLGIGSFSFVTAGVINARLVAAQIRIPNKSPSEASWLDLIRSEDRTLVDIGKLQQLAFTVMLVTIYVSGLYDVMAHTIDNPSPLRCKAGLPCSVTGFPKVDDGFVALLGVSHAAYLVSKQANLWGWNRRGRRKPRVSDRESRDELA